MTAATDVVAAPRRLIGRSVPLRMPRKRMLALGPGWPLTALFVLYPIWWALGLGALIFLIIAVPMGVHLVRHRPVRVPPGFGIWLLFLAWVVASLALLGVNPPGTVPNTVSGRLLPALLRPLEYASVTILLLYVGNLPTRVFSQRRLVRLLGTLFVWTVVGGIAGVVVPNLQFTSPVEMLLPSSMRQNPFVASLVHPAVAQLHDILGYTSPRPAAPFGYTNMWGNNFAILLIWFVIGWLIRGSLLRRTVGVGILAVSVIPVVYSLNRGLWIALAVSAVVIAVRLAAQGKVWAVGVLVTVLAVAAPVVALSPLQTLLTGRVDHGKSNDVRTFTTQNALALAQQSPVLGYGNTRNALGSEQSISVGKTADCPRCGNIAVGSNGQLWLVLVSQGFIGGALYVGFFLVSLWRYRRDRSAIGIGGLLAIGLPLLFMFVYDAMISPLALYFVSLGLLWRNDRLAGPAGDPR